MASESRSPRKKKVYTDRRGLGELGSGLVYVEGPAVTRLSYTGKPCLGGRRRRERQSFRLCMGPELRTPESRTPDGVGDRCQGDVLPLLSYL